MEPSFRIPRLPGAAAQDYQKEIDRIINETIIANTPSVSQVPEKKVETLSRTFETIDDIDTDFRIEMNCKQVFLGSQQISIKPVPLGNLHLEISSESQLVLKLVHSIVRIPISSVVGFGVYEAQNLGYSSILVVYLKQDGNKELLKKCPSLKTRFNQQKDEGVSEPELEMHQNTLIFVLKSTQLMLNNVVANVRLTDKSDDYLFCFNDSFLEFLHGVRQKLEVMSHKLDVDELGDDHFEEFMEALGLVWMKEDTNWKLKDKRQFLSCNPTMFVEKCDDQIIELTTPTHWARPLSRKRTLPFHSWSVNLEEKAETKYTVIKCDPSDYSPLLKSRHVNNLHWLQEELNSKNGNKKATKKTVKKPPSKN